MKVAYGFTIDEKLHEVFTRYCKDNGLVKSPQVEDMIKNWLIERGITI